MTSFSPQNIQVFEADVTPAFFEGALDSGLVACDIETTGLDWQSERIATCQVFSPVVGSALVRINGVHPERLIRLIASPSVVKVFHHAMFDLRFMFSQWGVRPQSIACTKILAKLTDPEHAVTGHHLDELVRTYLGVELDKSEQRSDWMAAELSDSQVHYAVEDVRYLIPLLQTLTRDLKEQGLEDLAVRCFGHIPTQVELDVRAFGNVFVY